MPLRVFFLSGPLCENQKDTSLRTCGWRDLHRNQFHLLWSSKHGCAKEMGQTARPLPLTNDERRPWFRFGGTW